MYRDTLIFKIRGLKLRGAKLNLDSAMLEVEENREFEQNLGPMQMEFTTFERDHKRFIEGEPSLPIIYNTSYNEQENNEDILESTLKNEIQGQKYLKAGRKLKKGDRYNLAKKLSVAGADIRNYVRLPVVYSSERSRKPFLNLGMYFYCYSLKNQVYWLKKGTYIAIEDDN